MATGQSQFPTALDTISNLLGAANNFQTVLVAPLAPSDTSAELASVAGLESAGPLTIIEVVGGVEVIREIVFYDGISGSNTQNLSRGADGSVAPGSTWPAGAIVRQNQVAAFHKASRAAILALEAKLGFSASIPNGNLQALMSDAAGASVWRALTTADIQSGVFPTARIPSLPTSQITGLDAALALLAPKASPALTGTPSAPTPAAGNNSTLMATTAYVRTEVANLVGAAPGTLDTLNELAIALGNDPNFASTITTALAGKQPLDGDLTAIAALSSDGLLRKSGGTWAMDAGTYLTANQTITLSGDVGGSGSTAITVTIGANKVTNAMLAQVATATFKGRTTAATGNVEDLTAAQATALLSVFVGDSGGGGTKGLVPAPAAGDAAANKFLKADGTFQVVTSVSAGNPTASVGLAAVNGSANTFMRSDAAPALSVTITPTWTGQHIWSLNNAAALVVGQTGATNPAFTVDTTAVGTGVKVTPAAAGAGVTLGVTSSGSNESLFLTPKGTGQIVVPLGSAAAPMLAPSTSLTSGLYWTTGTNLSVAVSGGEAFRFGSGGLFSANSGISLGPSASSPDAYLFRFASGVIRTGSSATNAAQVLVGTSTDTADAQLSVYSQSTTRPGMKMRALSGTAGTQNVFESYNAAGTLALAATSAGRLVGDTALPYVELTNANGAILGYSTSSSIVAGATISMTIGGTVRWNVNASGHLLAGADNAYTVGAAGASRPSYIYIAATTVSGVNSPAQITADQNNYNPGTAGKYLRLSTDASRSVTGLTFTIAQVTGQEHFIINVGSNNLVLINESASSTAANRFTNVTGADITLAANEMAMLVYDNTSARWRVAKM